MMSKHLVSYFLFVIVCCVKLMMADIQQIFHWGVLGRKHWVHKRTAQVRWWIRWWYLSNSH